MLIRYLLVLLSLLLSPAVYSQLVINEVCAYNGNLVEDEDDDEPDWIELYNEGTSALNLGGFKLKAGGSAAWSFPNIVLQPQEFILVYASGKNRVSPFFHTSFKLSRQGEKIVLIHPLGNTADELSYPLLHMDHSYGRKSDGHAGALGIFNLPTPGSSNASSVQFNGYATDPVFSIEEGFYNGGCILEMSGPGNATIHYTLNGSEPEVTSPLYTGPININSTTVVRTCSFSNIATTLPSHVITKTYFAGYQSELPVFSISTEPENFWDWNTGIYVTGPNANPNYPYYGANYWQDWEIKAHIEYFESGSRKISQDVGVKINGGSSNRTKAMKSLRLTSKNKFGNNSFGHKFFPDKNIDDFKIIVLRNSSGDFNKTHFRDGCLHKLMIGKTNIDLAAYRPSAVFINGDYFGVHNIREKISKHYLQENFGVDGNNVDLLEEDSTIIEGDFTQFNAMYDYITTHNLSNNEYYMTAASMMDVESLCDYYIAETFLSNIDWPYNNVKFWKVREPGNKWRYILIDLDIALGNNGWAPASFDILGRIMGVYGDNNRHVHIFRGFLQNPQFKEYFINRYADLVNTLFSSSNMEQHIINTRAVLENEMPLHFNVWGNDMAGWDHEIFEVAMPHVYDRPAFAMEQVREVFNLDKIVSLELAVWPPGAGTVTINTITPGPLPWKGNYFDGNAVTISVNPNPGFKFTSWVSDNLTVTAATQPSFRINPSANNKFTAYFSSKTESNHLMIFPNPVHDNFHIGFVSGQDGFGNCSVINTRGQVVFNSAMAVSKGVNDHVVDAGKLTDGVYMLKADLPEGVQTARLVVIR